MPSLIRPLSYGILAYPGFEELDITGPLKCLTTLQQSEDLSNISIAMIARPQKQIQKPISNTTPSKLMNNSTNLPQQTPLTTYTLGDAPPLDVLIIPGGYDTLTRNNCQQEIDFVARVYPSLQYLFTVCTGSALAAAAGVLNGHYATTNKALWNDITSSAPSTYWLANARWTSSGNIWTTASVTLSGASAGTDGMVALIEHMYGEAVMQRMIDTIGHRRVVDKRNDPVAYMYGCDDVPPTDESIWWKAPIIPAIRTCRTVVYVKSMPVVPITVQVQAVCA